MFERWKNKAEMSEDISDEVDLGNNVKLIRRSIDGESQIKIMRGDEEVVDLAALAPEGTKFTYGGKWGADYKEDTPEILLDRFKEVGDLVSFLHEVGHLEHPEDVDIRGTLKRKKYEEGKKDVNNDFPVSRLSAIKEEMEVVLKSERDAWASALKKARQLEYDLGVEIFSKLPAPEGIDREKIKDIDRVRGFINACLKTYEDISFDELADEDIFSREDLEKIIEFKLKRESKTDKRDN